MEMFWDGVRAQKYFLNHSAFLSLGSKYNKAKFLDVLAEDVT